MATPKRRHPSGVPAFLPASGAGRVFAFCDDGLHFFAATATTNSNSPTLCGDVYFQIFEKAVGKEETILFLTHLLRYIKTPLLVVWDRLPAHSSRLAGQFLDSLNGQIDIEYLPPYAPELNPVEYLWGHWTQHTLPNVCPKDLWQLSEGARRTLRRLRRRPRLITAFWTQASLAIN